MRIRKRPPPPPASSAPSLLTPDLPSSKNQPLSSLEASSNSRGLHPHDDLSPIDNKRLRLPCDSPNQSLRRAKGQEDRLRSDLQLLMIRGTNGWVCSHGEKEDEKKKKDCMHRRPSQDSRLGIGIGDGEAEEKTPIPTNRRNGNNPGAETSVGNSSSSSLSHKVVGRWCERERAFPLKKRRGGFEQKASEGTIILEKKKKVKKMGMKTKTNKKWVDHEEDEDEEIIEDGVDRNNVKKRGNGDTVMEGSRCSRVNGRGWRCCQQTLVGYSLCEHHLGKGRLRSMSSVRSRTSAINRPNFKKDESWQLNGLEDDDDDEKPLTITKRRKKIGMVKARSISSLLGLTLHAPQVSLQPSSDNSSNHDNGVMI
ncbi:hypothetical protein HHK36_017653 [Tetracentron sinense]|uniref:WRC domain-containing protein n=1 Tax=Tetracentron sinense TaxID=13715 RepID=A0A834Z002_TETSI|nr:hypothetical protein HHK36_017653 [Tetracentron sinense]